MTVPHHRMRLIANPDTPAPAVAVPLRCTVAALGLWAPATDRPAGCRLALRPL